MFCIKVQVQGHCLAGSWPPTGELLPISSGASHWEAFSLYSFQQGLPLSHLSFHICGMTSVICAMTPKKSLHFTFLLSLRLLFPLVTGHSDTLNCRHHRVSDYFIKSIKLFFRFSCSLALTLLLMYSSTLTPRTVPRELSHSCSLPLIASHRGHPRQDSGSPSTACLSGFHHHKPVFRAISREY